MQHFQGLPTGTLTLQNLGGSFHHLTALTLFMPAKPWPNTATGSRSTQTLFIMASASKGLGVWPEKQTRCSPVWTCFERASLFEFILLGPWTCNKLGFCWFLKAYFLFPWYKYIWASVLKALISLTTRLSLSESLSVHIYIKTLIL